MARRTLFWHIGLADAPRPVVGANLQAHREALQDARAEVVATAAQATLATHEVLHTHAGAGLARVEVEGQWAAICARVWQHKGVSLLSTPDICAADKGQIRFALDQLGGIEVHLVLTVDSFAAQLYGAWLAELRAGRSTGWEKYVRRVVAEPPEHRQAERFWAGHQLELVLARWGWTLHADRLHVVASADPGSQWSAYLDVAGIEEHPPAVVPPYADPAGVAVLRKVNRQLEDPAPGAFGLLAGPDEERAAMPVVATPSLEPLAERWADLLGVTRHDLRGDLGVLVGSGDAVDLPGPRDQLGTAVDALADALAENTRLGELVATLRADRDHLDAKRRKLKRRLRAAESG